MSTTQNVKGNRQIVVALCDFKQYFKIPDGLDLEDQTVVSSWSVSWGKLYIDYVDGRKTRDIIEYVKVDNYGIKDPADLVIEDAKTDEHNIEYEEDSNDNYGIKDPHLEIEDAKTDDNNIEYEEDCNDSLGRFISKKMDVLNELMDASNGDWVMSDLLELLRHDKEWVSENFPELINDIYTHCEECGKKNVLNEKINGDGRFYMSDLMEFLEDNEWVSKNLPKLVNDKYTWNAMKN